MTGGGGLGRCLAGCSVIDLRMMKDDPSIELPVSYKDVLYLNMIASAGSATVSELAAAARVARPTVTCRVNSLEERGYVVRERSEEDRRVVRIRLSGPMAEAYRKEWEALDALTDSLEARFGAERVAEFLEVLEAASGMMAGYPGAPGPRPRARGSY